MMKTHCDRCGKDCRADELDWVPAHHLLEISDAWKKFGVIYVCDSCGTKATSYINYWGRKKKEDIESLMLFLQSGKASRAKVIRVYGGLMNAGYYAEA